MKTALFNIVCFLCFLLELSPLWYRNWLKTILTVLDYAPQQLDAPNPPVARSYPIAPSNPSAPVFSNALFYPQAPFMHLPPPSSQESTEIVFHTLDDQVFTSKPIASGKVALNTRERAPKPSVPKKGTRYDILDRVRELEEKVLGI